MHQIDILRDLVIVLGAAVVVVAVLRPLRVPAIAGFILTGVLAGPTAIGLVNDTAQVEVLAEVGVILLLFGIGLELSLDRIRLIWKAVVIGGGIQVSLTVGATTLIAMGFGLSTGSALFLGCVVAVSSTAVVLRGLQERRALETPQGRLAVGILVFQDLCVVPMILIVPFLAGDGGSVGEVLQTTGIAVAVLVGVVVGARLVVPRLLATVAKTRQREIFVLAVFLICFGAAWAVSAVGISLALGAFLAGMVVAGSEFRHLALADILPAREVLASLFFVSVGMLLDLPEVAENLLPIGALLGAILVGKFTIILATALVLRLPLRVAIVSAGALSQVGEFSFVLLGAAAGTGLLGPELSNTLLVAIILSMLVTPLGISLAPRVASGVARIPRLSRLMGAEPPGVDAAEPHCDHVLVAGYGHAGRVVCAALKERQVPYVAVDTNPDNIRAALKNGDRAVLGDIARTDIEEALGCSQARAVAICINDPAATELAVRRLREHAPLVPIVARAPYDMDRPSLQAAGASTVVTAESAAAEALAAATVATLADNGGDGCEVCDRGA